MAETIVIIVLTGAISIAIAIISTRQVANKKIDAASTDLIEALKKHQVGINIPGMMAEKHNSQVKIQIKQILEKHFK